MIVKVAYNNGEVKSSVMLESGQVFVYRCDGLGREKTGIHGSVSISMDGRELAWGRINLERQESRTSLALGAYKASGIGDLYPAEDIKADLLSFCRQAWPVRLDGMKGSMLAGDATSAPPEFLAKPHVLRGGGTLLFGPPERGKSYTALIMAVAIDAGVNGYWQTEKSNVMYVNLERGAASVRRRLGCVNTALGLDPDRALLILNARGYSLSDVRESIDRSIKENGVELLVLDSISRAGMGDLTENRPVNMIADAMNSLAETWIGIGHTPRGDSTHIYGSVFLDAAADILLRQKSERQEHSLGVGLEVTKANDIARPPPMYLRYGFDEWGLSGISTAAAGDFPGMDEDTAGPLPSASHQLEELLGRGKLKLTDIYSALPDYKPGTIRAALSRQKHYVQVQPGVWGLVSQ